MQRLLKILARPGLYAGWAVVTLLALVSTYFSDPYIFGLATFLVAALTGALALAGLLSAALRSGLSRRSRFLILLWLAVASAAVMLAFAVLGRFNWA